MINGLNNSYAQLNGLKNIYADNVISTLYEDSTLGSYLTGITSNIQDQINNITTGTNYSDIQTQITTNLATEKTDIAIFANSNY